MEGFPMKTSPSPIRSELSMRTVVTKIILLFSIVLLALSVGCARQERNPIPVELISVAKIPGMDGIRDFSGSFSDQLQKDIELSIQQESKTSFIAKPSGPKVYKSLALSSGGPHGAFGAGFLVGWTAHGSRPDFKLVTGISTGAIIAPFAFLGPEYDPGLENLFTTISTNNLVHFKGLKTLVDFESIGDSSPMLNRMREIVDEKFLAQIAKEHNRGKRLLIGTTNLDAGQLVVWNMGKIANSGHPKALELFHHVILASASIPGVFPPVLFSVEAEGELYDEMHVDGGVKAQFFLTEALTDLTQLSDKAFDAVTNATKEIYVIRNGKLRADPRPVQRDIFDILKSTTEDMTITAVQDSLYRVYMFAEKKGADFNYIGVPEDYHFIKTKEYADEAEMIRLFNKGYTMAIDGPEWKKTLPGFDL